MKPDHSNKNLQHALLTNQDLSQVNFSGADLRGANLTGSDLTGADLSHTKTGLRPVHIILIFVVATALSLLSGYIAAHASLAIRRINTHEDPKLRIAGIVTTAILVIGIIYTCWKGGYKSVTHLFIPVVIIGVALAITSRLLGMGTGKNLLFLMLALTMVVLMIYIGTISRVAAGSLSNILFTVVALSGGMFGKSISGTIGPVILALICMLISKQALRGKKDYAILKKTAGFITEKFGTSFRHATLTNTNFSHAKLHNADFTGSDLSSVIWGDAKRVNCKKDDMIITDKKKKSHD